jgi:hypothetical protein
LSRASLERLPARQESPVAEAETAFDGCPRMPEDKREWKTTIDLTSGTSRRVGVPAHRDQTKWARTPKLLVFLSHRPRIFFKIPLLSNLRFLSPPPCLRVASFAPAHVALRAAFGRLPGQRPLARVPVSAFRSSSIRVDLPSFAGPKTPKTLTPAIERLPPREISLCVASLAPARQTPLRA